MNVGQDVNFQNPESPGGRPSGTARPAGARRTGGSSSVHYGEKSPRPKWSVDAVSIVKPALRRWPWLFVGLLAGGAIGAALGLWLWKMEYSSTVQMVRHEAHVAQDAYKPRTMDANTLIGRLEDPMFLRRVGDQMNPKLTSGQVLSRMKVTPQRSSGIMTVVARGQDAGFTTTLANTFAKEIVRFTQELQTDEAREALTYVKNDLAQAEAQLAEAQSNMPSLANADGTTTDPLTGVAAGKNAEEIKTARTELTRLLAKYTDAHPLVRQQRATIAALEAEAATGVSAATAEKAAADQGGKLPAKVVTRDEFEVSLFRVRQLESMRMQLQYRQQQVEAFQANPPGAFRVAVPASGDTLTLHRPWIKVGLLTAIFAMFGLTLATGQVLVREFVDRRLKTHEDAERVTGLPVIATLGDMRSMSMSAREDWAFRTWVALQDRLSFSPNHGLICGFTSSRTGDGRSTWIGMLAGAARKCGFRVLTIATKPTADATINAQECAEAAMAADEAAAAGRAAEARAQAVNGSADAIHLNGAATATATREPVVATRAAGQAIITRSSDVEPLRGVSADSEFTALTASALFTPAQVTEKLMGPDNDPLVHIPLPGWTWNLERRKQWQGALNVWQKIENVVILVELPPASQPESVLLASNLPNIVWLVESGKSEAGETRAQLQTLRHARCNLVGTVINRAMANFTEGRLSRWMSCITLLAVLGLGSSTGFAQATQSPAPAAPAPTAVGSFSVTHPAQRAEWQKKLTLGPGDVLNLALYGEPDLTLTEVPIGPDGRISYLEATDIMAAGLTVDELRDAMNKALGEFRREPQVIVAPVEIKSKKYYVLGKVNARGVYTLDRPTTLLEAVARAEGMETGLATDRTMIELADFSRAFVARRGQKVNVDFEKLFGEGDLSQNIALEPDDYIYFPAASLKEVYVIGAVVTPGPYAYTTQTGAVGAIAARGGFADFSYKSRVLVIRGSLQRPQTFVLNTHDVLSGKTPDLKLQPQDIVYVSKRPWWRAEDLLDEAATAFVTSAVVVWTGMHVTN